jgi:hypothetical protein
MMVLGLTLLQAGCALEVPAPDAPAPAEREAGLQSNPVVLQRTHIQRDLYWRGCNAFEPYSLACRWAANLRCQELGYASGYGVVEVDQVIADVLCVPASLGTYREFPYGDACTSSDPTSIHCQSRARRECLREGYMGATGVIGANPNVIATTCLKPGPELRATSLGALQAANPQEPRCTSAGIISGNGCQHNTHRWCRSLGYSAGFGPQEYDAATGAAGVICTGGVQDTAGLYRPGTFDGYERAAVLGDNVLGGPAFAWNPARLEALTYGDSLYNAFPHPILVRKISSGSSYPGPVFSKDACLYLNRPATYQFDDNDDGEVNCTYSDTAQHPTVDLLNRGLVLYPGERVVFQATPQWGAGGQGHHAWTTLHITAPDGVTAPLRRVRFPKWDTAYSVNGTLYVGAGYNGAASVNTPSAVPPGKPLQESNWWYPVPRHTAIRGLSVFLSNGQAPGVQGVSACVRVVYQGGAPVRPPICFDFQGDLIGPSSFPGNNPGVPGSAFIPMDVDVPAGVLLGIDFTLRNPSGTPLAMDFAGYLWLDQR